MKKSSILIMTFTLIISALLNVQQCWADTEQVTLLERMNKKISIDFRETSIDDVLRMFAQQANINIVKSPRVTGTVTASLVEVPLSEALQNILAVHGYAYIASDNMLRVMPVSDIEPEQARVVRKVYRVDYQNFDNVANLAEQLISRTGTLHANEATRTIIVTETGENLRSFDRFFEEINRKELTTRSFHIKYADVQEVTAALQRFISAEGQITSNPGTNDIIITDTESKMQEISAFIDRLDRITQQVLVEARIYDVTSQNRFDLGIQWQTGRNTTFAGNEIGAIGNVTGGDRAPFVTGAFRGATNQASTDGILRFGYLDDNTNIDAVVRAQQDDVSAQLLANPRVLVINNAVANIKIVREIPYQQLTQTALGAGAGIGTTQFKEVGVELMVQPRIIQDGDEKLIRLKLKPSFSTQVDTFELALPGAEQRTQVPVIDTRETETIALVRDGQTVVLGGLRSKTTNVRKGKVPLLGDIPLLGALFQYQGDELVNSELVVFITSHVVDVPLLKPDEIEQLAETYFEKPNMQEPILEPFSN